MKVSIFSRTVSYKLDEMAAILRVFPPRRRKTHLVADEDRRKDTKSYKFVEMASTGQVGIHCSQRMQRDRVN